MIPEIKSYWLKFSSNRDLATAYLIAAFIMSVLFIVLAFRTFNRSAGKTVEIPRQDRQLMQMISHWRKSPLDDIETNMALLGRLCASFPLGTVEIKESAPGDAAKGAAVNDKEAAYGSSGKAQPRPGAVSPGETINRRIDPIGTYRDCLITYKGDIYEQLWLLRQIEDVMGDKAIIKEISGKSDSITIDMRVYGRKPFIRGV